MPTPSLQDLFFQREGREARDMSQQHELDSNNMNINYVTPHTILEQQRAAKEVEENAPSIWETAGLAVESETSIGAGLRLMERTGREYDKDFKLSDEKRTEAVSLYSKREQEYLLSSHSEEEWAERKKDIQEDRDREERLNSAGYTGLGFRLAAGILDPANLIIGAATGGLGTVSRVGRLGQAVRAGLIAAGENVALDAVLTRADTQRDWDDLFLSAATGFVVGGGISALRRVKASEVPEEDYLIKSLDDIDETLNHTARQLDEDKLVDEVVTAHMMEYDGDAVESAIKKHETELQIRASRRPLGKKEIKKHTQRKVDAESSIEKLQEAKTRAIAEYWAKVGVPKPAERSKHDAHVDRVERRFEAALHLERQKLDKAVKKLDGDFIANDAKHELIKWRTYTPEQKKEILFPNYTPVRHAQVQKTRKVLKSSLKSQTDEALKFREKEAAEAKGRGEEDRSVGAAQTQDELMNTRFFDRNVAEQEEEFLDDMINRTEEFEDKAGRNWVRGIPDMLLGDYSILTQHDNVAVRALANLFLANPQTGKFGENVATTAHLFNAEIRKAGNAAIDRGFDEHLRELGVNKANGYVNPKIREAYDTQVALAVKGIISDAEMTEGMRIARDGVRAQLAKALELRKRYGELGFEKIDTDPNYLPDIMSREGISHLSYSLGWGKNDIMKLIEKGYKSGDNELSDSQARLMAFIKYNSWTKGELYDGDVHSIYRANSALEAKQLLEKAKVPSDLIESFMKDVDKANDWATVSNRARKTLKINWEANHTVNGRTIRISDVMNTNVSQLVEAYTKESAYGAAMARNGIKSEGQRNRLFLQVREAAKEDFGTDSTTKSKDIDALMQRLEKAVTTIQGKPLVDYSSKANRAGRMVLDLTSILRLQQAGFASIADAARALNQVGLADTLRAVPGSGLLRNPFNRASGRTVGEFKAFQQDMEELEDILGFFEEDNFHHSFTSRSEEFGSDARSRIGKALENSIEGTKRISQWMSLFNTIQGGISKISARAVNRRLIRAALGDKKLSKSLEAELFDTGMTRENWGKISEWVKKNHKVSERDGRKHKLWNFDEMPNDLRFELKQAMSRLHTRNVQRGLAGETNSDWYGPYARFVTQFKTHSLISVEKQIVHDMRGNLARAAGVTLWGMGLAYFAYAAQMNLRALGMSDSERRKYLNDNMTGKNLYWGIFNKHSQLASGGLLSDMGIFTGILPEEMYDSTRYGYQRGQLESMIPAAGVIEDALKVSGGFADLAYSPFRNGKSTADESKELSKSILRSTPLANSIYLGTYIKNAAGLQ